MADSYVHGYGESEHLRLQDQASTLSDLLHHDTRYPAGCSVLEAGCGVGSQTITLARRSPHASFTSVDISGDSVEATATRVRDAEVGNVQVEQADIFDLPYEPNSFDHVFVCFVLEHLRRPVEALRNLKSRLKAGGTITVIEGDHGSTYFHPANAAASHAIECQVTLQAAAGGNALIGRELHPLLAEAGFSSIRVSPRMVYVDANRPDLADGFTRKTFTAMIRGVRDAAIENGLTDSKTFDAGIVALERSAEPDGVFCYTFFKAVAMAE